MLLTISLQAAISTHFINSLCSGKINIRGVERRLKLLPQPPTKRSNPILLDSKSVIMMVFQGKRMTVNSGQRGAHFNGTKFSDVSKLYFLSCQAGHSCFRISAKAENWVISIPLTFRACLLDPPIVFFD